MGAAIPLGAAILELADAWDAMTTGRPYQQALAVERAVEELRDGPGTQFAPAVVDAFLATAAQAAEAARGRPRGRELAS